MTLIFSVYLIAGLALVFIGPAAKGLRLELAELAYNHPKATVKRTAFACAAALAIILLWPVMVPSAWRTLNPTTLAGAAYLAAKLVAKEALHNSDKQSESQGESNGD
jgi:hypothetical protein